MKCDALSNLQVRAVLSPSSYREGESDPDTSAGMSPRLRVWTIPLPLNSSPWFVMSIVPLPTPCCLWLKLCYLPSPGLWRILSFLRSGFWPCSGQLWTTRQAITYLVTEYVRRGEEKWNLVHLCQYSLMEPTPLSAAGHRLGQENHQSALEVPVGFSITESRSGGAPQGSSFLLSSGFFSQWEHPPFFLAARGGQSFQGLARPEIPPVPGERKAWLDDPLRRVLLAHVFFLDSQLLSF